MTLGRGHGPLRVGPPGSPLGARDLDWSALLGTADSKILAGRGRAGGRIRGLPHPGGEPAVAREIEAVEGAAKAAGAPGLLWAKRTADGGSGPLSRWLEDASLGGHRARPGDLLLVAAGRTASPRRPCRPPAAAIIEALAIPKVREHAWLWVLDFPLFEEEDGRLWANHHPFVLPHPDDLDARNGSALGAGTRVRSGV
jgi:aspartyl-tRNA synthetase